jgi:hypothetical protein
VPLVICVVIVIRRSLFSEVNMLSLRLDNEIINNISSLAIALGFLVKLPIFGVHL